MSFANRLLFGNFDEITIHRWILERGKCHILPVDPKRAGNGCGPRIKGHEQEIISPDILVVKNRDYRFYAGNEMQLCWIEVKGKQHFTWYRHTGEWQTGIDIRPYEEYRRVRDTFAWPLWILFLHHTRNPSLEDIKQGSPAECPAGLFSADLDWLVVHEDHRCEPQEWCPTGMVYWDFAALKHLATLDEIEVIARKIRKERADSLGDIP